MIITIFLVIKKKKGFPGGSVVKNPPATAKDTDLNPGLERTPWRRKWQPTPPTHSSTFAWEIPWTEEPGRL